MRDAWKSIGRARSVATRPSLMSMLMFHSANQVMSELSRKDTSRYAFISGQVKPPSALGLPRKMVCHR